MRLPAQFAVFFGVMFGLSLIGHYYIFAHLSYLLRIPPTWLYWTFVVLSALSFFLGMALGWRFKGPVAQAVHVVALTWLGVLMYMLFTLFFYDGVRLTYRSMPYLYCRSQESSRLYIVVLDASNTQFRYLYGDATAAQRPAYYPGTHADLGESQLFGTGCTAPGVDGFPGICRIL